MGGAGAVGMGVRLLLYLDEVLWRLMGAIWRADEPKIEEDFETVGVRLGSAHVTKLVE